MAKGQTRMDLIADLAAKKRKEADQYLADAKQRVANDEQAIKQLEAFLLEYQQGLITAGQSSLTHGNLGVYQRFIEKLMDALGKQRASLAQNQQQLTVVQRHWEQVYRYQRGIDKLAEKRRIEAQRAADKKDQKNMDELASRRIEGFF